MSQFDDVNVQLLGMSVDSVFALKTWAMAMGGIRHPLLSDFWPHGAAAQALDIFNADAGIVNRSVIVIDPDGVVRHGELHQRTLPEAPSILAELKKLQG